MVGNSVGRQGLPHGSEASPNDGSPAQMRMTPRRRGPQGATSSTMSLSDDHFDQYTLRARVAAGLPTTTTAYDAALHDASTGDVGMESRLRRNRPSLIRQSEVNDVVVRKFICPLNMHFYINIISTFLVKDN